MWGHKRSDENMMNTRRVISITVLLFALIAQAAGLEVSVSDATGAKGGTALVPLNLSGASAIGSMDIVLKYDPGILRAMSVEGTGLGENAYIEANTAKEGEAVIALADSRGMNGDGAFAIVSFEVLGGIGSTSQLTIEKVTVHNIDLVQISATTKSATLKVTGEAPKSGDGAMVILEITAILAALFVMRGRK
jgi:hypothetical protein